MAFFSDFHMVLGLLESTADLLTVVSDRIARGFNRSGATRDVALDISKLFTGFGMLVFFTNLIQMEYQLRYLTLFLFFSIIDSFSWFWMESIQKNIRRISEVNANVPQGSFLVLHFSYNTLMIFLYMSSVIMLSVLMILPSTLKCDQVSDL